MCPFPALGFTDCNPQSIIINENRYSPEAWSCLIEEMNFLTAEGKR
jgi:hypothetical protein